LYEIVPGFIAASLAILVASLLDRAPPAEVQATHDAVRAELREHGY
jgi:sodium/proline symporter